MVEILGDTPFMLSSVEAFIRFFSRIKILGSTIKVAGSNAKGSIRNIEH